MAPGLGRRLKVVADEALLEPLEGRLGSTHEFEQIHVLGRNRSGIGQHFEVDHTTPIFLAVEEDGHLLGELFSLGKGQDLEEFVEGPEATGENDQGLGKISKPELAHEEVVELEVELRSDVGIGDLLKGQGDVEADGFAASLPGAPIGGFHDSGTASGGDDEAMALAWQSAGPIGEHVGESASILIVV